MSTRVERLVKRVNSEVTLWNSTNEVKLTVGDSISNNRVPTVRQTIRYLNQGFFTQGIANDLEEVYAVLRKKNLFRKLRRNNFRTDAFDINELGTVISKYVAKDSSLKSTLARLIKYVL